jgi:ELWxxDGT repeat protein
MQTFYYVVTLLKKIQPLLFLVAILTAQVSDAQVRLVADLDPLKYETSYLSETKHFTLHVTDGTRSFFVANGTELWTSNGTTDGTRVVKRFMNISAAFVLNGTCYFAAHTDDIGVELWKSDGTPGGTILLKDIYPGRGNSSPTDFAKIGNVLYFSANNKVNGRELWKTDGTPGGTQLVADINPGAPSSGPNKFAVLNGQVLFSADNGVNGTEVWSSNGTSGGTVMLKDIYTGIYSSIPQDLVVANGLLFFTAATATDGRQLWTSDGTSPGTTLLKIINPGHTRIGRLTPANNLVFFEAADFAHGLELWRSDGTEAGTFIAKDLTPGPESNTAYAEKHLDSFGAINGKLFFKAVAEYGPRLWMSDGTPEGTVQLPVTGDEPVTSWFDIKFHEINGEAYFMAMSDWDQNHLYKSDMNGNVTLVRNNITDNISENPLFASMNGLLFFLSRDHYWRTDGTTAGTFRVKQTGLPAGSDPTQLHDLDGSLIFSTSGPGGLWRSEGTASSTTRIHTSASIAYGAAATNNILIFSGSGDRAWRTDGTPAGTFVLNTEARYPYRFAAANGLVFFNASTTTQGEELWQSDGTVAGTHITKDIAPGTAHTIPRTLLGTATQVFFPIFTQGVGNELWRSDGTESGTYLVKDIYPGSQSSEIRSLVNFNDKAYFFANDGVNGMELWTSDGTAAGTLMVKNINVGDPGDPYDMITMTATDNHVLFSAFEGTNMTLWRSNGTGTGTYKIANIIAQGDPIFIGSAGDDAMFVLAFDTYIELWKSDGTATGTRKVHTLNNHYFGYGYGTARVGNVVYFMALHHANEIRSIWRTDGTTTGTYQIEFDGQPRALAASGPYLYFSGASHKYGSELFLVDEGLSGARGSAQARVQVAEEVVTTGLSHFPNPFHSDLTVSMKGGEDDVFDLEVLNMNGARIFERHGLSCNTTHTFKPDWHNGVYIMRVLHNNSMITKKIVKTQE